MSEDIRDVSMLSMNDSIHTNGHERMRISWDMDENLTSVHMVQAAVREVIVEQRCSIDFLRFLVKKSSPYILRWMTDSSLMMGVWE